MILRLKAMQRQAEARNRELARYRSLQEEEQRLARFVMERLINRRGPGRSCAVPLHRLRGRILRRPDRRRPNPANAYPRAPSPTALVMACRVTQRAAGDRACSTG